MLTASSAGYFPPRSRGPRNAIAGPGLTKVERGARVLERFDD
jgi:hypothetical protein